MSSSSSSAIIFEDICLVAYLEGRWASPFTFKRSKREHDADAGEVHARLMDCVLGVIYCPWCGDRFES